MTPALAKVLEEMRQILADDPDIEYQWLHPWESVIAQEVENWKNAHAVCTQGFLQLQAENKRLRELVDRAVVYLEEGGRPRAASMLRAEAEKGGT